MEFEGALAELLEDYAFSLNEGVTNIEGARQISENVGAVKFEGVWYKVTLEPLEAELDSETEIG